MIELDVFPGGKRYCTTFSYDDGCDNDQRLIELLDRYGMKGTFHLNAINYRDASPQQLAQISHRYRNHEIACHTYSHGYPPHMSTQTVVREVLLDRQLLEKIAGYPVCGMSYPFGAFSDEVIQAMKFCGIEYSRTTQSTKDYWIPRDFMRWHPTCHHRDAAACTQEFLRRAANLRLYPLLYIWGHSSEFVTQQQWDEFEQVLQQLAEHPNMWFATNIQILRYIQAQRRLEITLDEKYIYNPSAMDVWIRKDQHQVLCIPAGQSVVLP